MVKVFVALVVRVKVVNIQAKMVVIVVMWGGSRRRIIVVRAVNVLVNVEGASVVVAVLLAGF